LPTTTGVGREVPISADLEVLEHRRVRVADDQPHPVRCSSRAFEQLPAGCGDLGGDRLDVIDEHRGCAIPDRRKVGRWARQKQERAHPCQLDRPEAEPPPALLGEPLVQRQGSVEIVDVDPRENLLDTCHGTSVITRRAMRHDHPRRRDD
jgi:hypothetical protein